VLSFTSRAASHLRQGSGSGAETAALPWDATRKRKTQLKSRFANEILLGLAGLAVFARKPLGAVTIKNRPPRLKTTLWVAYDSIFSPSSTVALSAIFAGRLAFAGASRLGAFSQQTQAHPGGER
jgi:hypothetical protein